MTWDELSLQRYRSAVTPVATLLLLTAFALWRVDANVGDLVRGIGKGLELLAFFFPPAWRVLPEMIEPALVTVLLALTATPIGAVCALVFGLAAARNVSPPWLRTASRT